MSMTPQPHELPHAIVIVGDGQLGVLTAIALRRALPTTSVTVVHTPADPGDFADRIGTAMPFTNRLHDQLGIDELDLVRKAGASHRLITRYLGWPGSGEFGLADYGSGSPTLGNAFTGKFDGVRGGSGAAERYELSSAIALASTGRFQSPDGASDSALAGIDYALRWNVGACRDHLIEHALRLGVEYAPQLPANVEHDGEGDLLSITLEDGNMLAADLFVDCSGQARWLMSRMAGAAFDSWLDLPCDQVLLAAPAQPLVELEDRMTLTPVGWLGEIAGRDGLQSILSYPSALDGPEVEAVLRQSGISNALRALIHPGALAQNFVGNVVALGDAAASFEPIGGANLDLAHRQLALLLELLPGRHIEPRERDEYNRRSGLMAGAMRDWLASHFLSLLEGNTPFARHVGGLRRSSTLALLADQFGRQGRMPFFEEAPMAPGEWSRMLNAIGVASQPSAYAIAQPPEWNKMAQERAAKAAQAAHDAAPPYRDWILSVMQAA